MPSQNADLETMDHEEHGEKRMKAYEHPYRHILEVDTEPTVENEPVQVMWDELKDADIPPEVPMFQEQCFDNSGRLL